MYVGLEMEIKPTTLRDIAFRLFSTDWYWAKSINYSTKYLLSVNCLIVWPFEKFKRFIYLLLFFSCDLLYFFLQEDFWYISLLYYSFFITLFFIPFTFLSAKGPQITTLDLVFHISVVHTPTFLYFDLYFYILIFIFWFVCATFSIVALHENDITCTIMWITRLADV